MRRLPVLFATLGLLTILLPGCKSAYDAAYYRTMEAFGKEKRDILVDRVDEARESQEEAKEQFSSALEEFSALIGFEGGELETVYKRLEADFERSESRADDVRKRIASVDDVAQALFQEWEEELEQYTDQRLRRASEAQLRQTQTRYAELIRVMRRAEAKMNPVLDAFRDQVLFLKHNLNAQAVASMENTAQELETDVATLIEEMEASIEEANRFIEEMQGRT